MPIDKNAGRCEATGILCFIMFPYFFPLLVIFLFLLFNSSLIQSLAVTFGVLQVFLISTCKVVSAA